MSLVLVALAIEVVKEGRAEEVVVIMD